MRRPGLALQLGVAFAVVAGITAMLAAGIVTLSWQRTFDSYVAERVQTDAKTLAEMTARSYAIDRGWTEQSLVEIATVGVSRGLRVQILDHGSAVLLDSATLSFHSGIAGMSGVPGAAGITGAQAEATPLSQPVVRIPVYVDDSLVGAVRVASVSPGSFLTDQDVRFRSASSTGMLIAALLAVGLATVGGAMYSRVFSRPIERVTRTAGALRSGQRDARTGMTGDDPVRVLGRTLDEMADSIQAEREFERRLTADVAHELRTPLQAIQATVEAMQDGVLPADGEHLGVVRDETVRLGRLAGSILELSRLENRSVTMRTAPIDLGIPLSRSVETHRALIDSLDLRLVEESDEGAIVLGDVDRLTQAFGNLMSNAAHYTPEGGTISVRLMVMPPHAVVTVTDTGIGISEADRERVFSRFWRSDEARQRARTGFGVGLSIVREIVEQHGGDVSLAPAGEGPGTVATVRVPLMDRKSRQSA